MIQPGSEPSQFQPPLPSPPLPSIKKCWCPSFRGEDKTTRHAQSEKKTPTVNVYTRVVVVLLYRAAPCCTVSMLLCATQTSPSAPLVFWLVLFPRAPTVCRVCRLSFFPIEYQADTGSPTRRGSLYPLLVSKIPRSIYFSACRSASLHVHLAPPFLGKAIAVVLVRRTTILASIDTDTCPPTVFFGNPNTHVRTCCFQGKYHPRPPSP